MALLVGTHAGEIIHTPSAAVVTELNNSNKSRDIIYLQGLAGLKAKIGFPYLKNIIATVGSNVVVNRAELVVSPVPGSTIPFGAQPKITLYRYNISKQVIELPDASTADPRSGGGGTFGGFYNTTDKKYHFIVTAYVQDLINGKTQDYGTYLASVDTTNKTSVDINPTTQTAARTIAVGTDKNSPYRIKLNIIYTKINGK
jgi:hypothetical protein